MSQMPNRQGMPVSRRGLLLSAATACSLPAAPLHADSPPELTVTQALRERKSTRSFSARALDPALLAELLWAAFGINRPGTGLHTAPSWRGVADMIVYAATKEGTVVYEPEADRVKILGDADIRGRLSPQPFVATAPVCLVYVSDLRRLGEAGPEDERRLYAMVDAAVASENVYLLAAARGLGTCLVGGVDRAAISAGLGLAGHAFPTFVQPVGWPT